MHCRGIEPRSPAWQARILPLNQQCLRSGGNEEDQLLYCRNIYIYKNIYIKHAISIRGIPSADLCVMVYDAQISERLPYRR